jgi:hypothetical protein
MEFPTYFHNCYSHMILVDDDDCVHLVPPNQLDWHFILVQDKTSEDVWHVSGVREYEEIQMTYIRRNGEWNRKS